MKLSIQLAVLSTLVFSSFVQAKGIYGEDNRVEVSEATPFQQKLAKSAATMISSKKMTRDPAKPGLVQLEQTSLSEWLASSADKEEEDKGLFKKLAEDTKTASLSFCEGERFVEQPNAGMCSGFLIAPDLIVTAGHCASLPTICSEYQWVFDFKVDSATKTAGIDVKEENIYKCKKVVSSALSMILGHDYGVIQLDRAVTGREPLEIRNDSKIDDYSPLVIIGSPSGLPLKVAAGANVRSNTHPFYFKANTDSYQGNSGSAVINAETGVVEGILVRGDQDFVGNKEKMCVESVRCTNDGCRGEDISRLTSIPEVSVQVAFNKAALNGDIVVLSNILKLNLWVDFYGKDRQSALMKAAQGGQRKALELLIAKGADVNLTDVEGNTAAHFLAKNRKVNFKELSKVLLDAGADLTVKNNAGRSALDLLQKKK